MDKIIWLSGRTGKAQNSTHSGSSLLNVSFGWWNFNFLLGALLDLANFLNELKFFLYLEKKLLITNFSLDQHSPQNTMYHICNLKCSSNHTYINKSKINF